ncbi:MAG: hypothetical protein WC851_05175 [Candidatus Shapirobacteria bacterium]|jgi:hypothetical protein
MPSTINDIEFHVRSYRSALKSNLEITINSLANPHNRLESILHPYGENPVVIDFSALVYSLLRLPSEIDHLNLVVMGQNPDVFAQHGFPHIETWPQCPSPARRRTNFVNISSGVIASLIGSISDVDDIINNLIAYQVEWNKLHLILVEKYKTVKDLNSAIKSGKIITDLNASPEDWSNFSSALGKDHQKRLQSIYTKFHDIRIRLLAGSWIDYTKTVQRWWKNVASAVSHAGGKSPIHMSKSSIYFVSSNTHSLLNLFTGFPIKTKNILISKIKKDRPQLYELWQQIQAGNNSLPEPDFLFYISKFYAHDPSLKKIHADLQKQLGVITIPSSHILDINVQIFPLKNIVKSKYLSPQISVSDRRRLAKSKALIFNIDYPLGFAAYHILNEILENVHQINGVYVLGKAAVLNSELGDVEVPKVVFDEHTQNTYMFNNCFNTFFPFPNNQGSILTNQKAVSVLGTFLENEALLKKYFDNNLTIIEMESGPYLSAISEATYDQQFPRNSIVDLHGAPFDVGIINYTSDTPYSKAKNLGTGSLQLNGAEPVYLGTLSILQRIINREEGK